MSRKIFINLPVQDLQKSIDFFTHLGFTFNPQFTDENATSMIVSDDITVMLLTGKFFKTFTDKNIVDAKKSTEVILCLSATSRTDVDEIISRVKTAGGTSTKDATDHGWMYYRSFEDLDGHMWEIAYIDENAIPNS